MADKTKDSFYFSHDMNARNDPRILEMMVIYDWAGYGMYWALVELMGEASPDHELSFSQIAGLARSLSVKKEDLSDFITDCCKEPILLYKSNNDNFWSESLKRRMQIKEDKRRQKVEAGIKGAQTRWNPESDGTAITENGKGKETEKNVNIKGNGKHNGPQSADKNSSTDNSSNSDSSIVLKEGEELGLIPTEHQRDIIKSRFFMHFDIELCTTDLNQFCNSNKDLKEEFIRSTNKSWFENLLLAIHRMKIRSDEKPIKDPILYFSKGITRKDSEPFLLLPDKYEEDNYTTYNVLS